MAILPYPTKRNNFIDEDELYKIVVGKLKLSEDFLEHSTPRQLGLLLQSHHQEQEEHYEMISYAFKVAYVSAKDGKNRTLFEKKNSNQNEKTSKEEKEETLKYLDEVFNEGRA